MLNDESLMSSVPSFFLGVLLHCCAAKLSPFGGTAIGVGTEFIIMLLTSGLAGREKTTSSADTP